MKSYQIIGLIGILILLISGFLPLAYLNEQPISIFPIYNNLDIEGIWIWRDISAFGVTFGITLLINIYLILRRYKPGYLISASLNFAAFLFIYISVWLTSIKINDFTDLLFSYTIWIIVVLVGYICFYYGGLKISRE